MSAIAAAAPAIAMVAAFILAWFGIRLARRPDERTKGILMIVMALVLIGNVVIWVI